jgi:hypothetical protein
MMNILEGGGYRNHHSLRFPVFPFEHSDFIKIQHQIGWTALYCCMHAAYGLIKKFSWNLQARFFLRGAFLFGPFTRMT